MKKKILIINPPPWGVDMFPLPASCIHSFLDRYFESEFKDLNRDIYDYLKKEKLWKQENVHVWVMENTCKQIYQRSAYIIDRYIDYINTFQPDYIGISLTCGATLQFVRRLLLDIKRRAKYNVNIICGGSINHTEQFTKIVMSVLQNTVDFFVRGEGEEVVYRIVKQKSLSTIHTVPNIYVNTKIIQFYYNDFSHFKDISEPNYHFTYEKNQNPNLKRYPFLQPPKNLYSQKYAQTQIMPFFLTRGCDSRCAFCNDSIKYKGIRYKKINRIVKELEYDIRNYNKKTFYLHDLLINGDNVFLEKLCKKIIQKKLDITLSGYFRIDRYMTHQRAELLKKAGFQLVIGVDNFSDKILQKMNKHYRYNDIVNNLKILSEKKVNYKINYILGFPGETEFDFYDQLKKFHNMKRFIPAIDALGALSVNVDSLIDLYPEKYGIIVPDVEQMHNKWYTKNKDNTQEIRKKRVKIFKNAANKFGIPIGYTNTEDQL